MLISRNDPRYYFSEDQYLSDEQYDAIRAEYKQRVETMMTTDLRVLFAKMKVQGPPGNTYDEDGLPISGIGKIFAFLVVAAFISLIVAAAMKKIAIFGLIFSCIFLVLGLVMLFQGRSSYGGTAYTTSSSTSSSIDIRITGFYMALMSGGVACFILNKDRFEGAEAVVWCAFVICVATALFMFVKAVIGRIASKVLYRGRADARCVGYVRTMSYDDSVNNTTRTKSHLYISTSPIFEYSYDGVRYEAVYDVFPAGRDSDIRLEQSVEIAVDESDPGHIMSPVITKASAMGLYIFIGTMFLLGAVLTGYLISSGKAAEAELNNGNAGTRVVQTESAKTRITDEMVEELYADKMGIDEWYVEIVTVTSVKTGTDGVHAAFDDEDMRGVLYVDVAQAPEVGDELLFFYYVNEEEREDGISYKHSFSEGDPDLFEYIGDHGTYVPPDS